MSFTGRFLSFMLDNASGGSMKKSLALFSMLLALMASAAAQDFARLDTLHDRKELGEELAALKKLYSEQDPQAAVVFRLLRCMQQIGVDMPQSQKKEKIARYDEVLAFGKPLLDVAKGSQRDRARMLYWYAVSIGQKGKAQGVLNSLFLVPEIKSYCDKSTAIDPSFGDPYYLKAVLDDSVPEVAGGNKTRMAQLYAKALELDPDNIWYLADFATGLKKRNKDAAFNKDGSKGVPSGLSDIAYAKQLAKRADEALSSLKEPSIEQRQKVDEIRAAGL
jgi:hypothetical protein